MLEQLRHDGDLNITEQAADIVLPDVVAAEPGPRPRDVTTALLHPGERGVEIPVGRPISGNIRSDLSHGSEYCLLIFLATRLLKPEVLHEGEHPAGNKHVSGLLPADLGVNPVKRRRREHGLKLLAGKRCILELSVHEFHRSSTVQVPPGQGYEVLAG